MKNSIHSAWVEASPEDRFAFLVLIDQMYGEGKGERGRGLKLIQQSYMGKLKRIEEGNQVGRFKLHRGAA